MSRTKTPTGGTWEVAFGTAELVRDLDRPDAWLLQLDGVPQSYVDRGDPTHLEFEYVRLLADVLDGLPAGPVRAVHLGGGACTLPRWVAATRPGSTQVVVEADAPLVEVVRQQLGTDGFKLRVGDAREALGALQPGLANAVVTDVFVGATVPGHLVTVECAAAVAQVLRPGGTYLLNVADSGGLGFARSVVQTLLEVFAGCVVLADPGVLRGRRFGNLVLAASDAPLPVDHLRRVTARAAGRARLEDGQGFARGPVLTDGGAFVVPTPPDAVFGRP